MSGQREREKRREERLQQETAVESEERRKRLLQYAAGAAFLVIAVVLVLIVVQSASDDGGGDVSLEEVSAVNQELSGIPERNMVLGDPGAKVELIEFGDLQCTACKAYSEEVLPAIIEGQVKEGKAKIAFRNFKIIGPDSIPAGAAALAAGAQNRGWHFLDIFYKNQGKENAGYVDDEFLTAVAKAAGVEDIARWNRERESAGLTEEVEATTAEALKLGFNSTPSFAIKGPNTNGMELLGSVSGGEIEAAIEKAG